MALDRLPINASTAGAVDSRAVDALRDPAANVLRARASSDPKSVIKAAAKQFEALFMQQLMKSMRESTLASGMLISLPSGTKLAAVVKALNSLGATPQDLLTILQAMKAAGALNAEIEVI